MTLIIAKKYVAVFTPRISSPISVSIDDSSPKNMWKFYSVTVIINIKDGK